LQIIYPLKCLTIMLEIWSPSPTPPKFSSFEESRNPNRLKSFS
jgi:hypothetical protein